MASCGSLAQPLSKCAENPKPWTGATGRVAYLLPVEGGTEPASAEAEGSSVSWGGGVSDTLLYLCWALGGRLGGLENKSEPTLLFRDGAPVAPSPPPPLGCLMVFLGEVTVFKSLKKSLRSM